MSWLADANRFPDDAIYHLAFGMSSFIDTLKMSPAAADYTSKKSFGETVLAQDSVQRTGLRRTRSQWP